MSLKRRSAQVILVNYCKSCGSYFTDRRTSVSLKNKEVWFREWVIGKQTIIKAVQKVYRRRFCNDVPYISPVRSKRGTRKPKNQAARERLELVHLLGYDQSGAQLWMRAFIDRYWNWETFINTKIKAFRSQLRSIRNIPFFMFRLEKLFA